MNDNQEYNLQRDPKQWPSGREHMSEAQRIELGQLSNQTGEPMADEYLSKAEASEKIKELSQEAGISLDDDQTDTVLGDDE
jgi:hypothetical protein